MTENTITKRKWFWAWQDDKEEAWLSEMAKQGYHLISANFIGSYTFAVGEPKDTTYRLDFYFSNDYEGYKQLFADSGWELVCVFGGWQYFRTEKDVETLPEIYTDKDSKVVKYQRVMLYLTIFLPIFIMMVTNDFTASTGTIGWIYKAVQVFMRFYVFVYIAAMIMLLRRISQIKKG